MAHKYGLLPSELLSRANTLDIKVFDVAIKYEAYSRKKAETGQEPAPKLSQDQLQAMMNRVKAKK